MSAKLIVSPGASFVRVRPARQTNMISQVVPSVIILQIINTLSLKKDLEPSDLICSLKR